MSDIFRQLSELELNKATVIQPLRLLNFSLLSNINLPAPLALRHALGAARATYEREPASNRAFRFPSPLVSAESQQVGLSMPSLRQMSLASIESGLRRMAQPTHLVPKESNIAGEEQLAENAVTGEAGRSRPDFIAPVATVADTAAQTAAMAASLHPVSPTPISPSQEVTGSVIQRRSEIGITTSQPDRQVAVPELPIPVVDPIQPPVIAATAGRHSAVEVEPPSIAAPNDRMAIDGPSPNRAMAAGDQMRAIESPSVIASLEARVTPKELDSTFQHSQLAAPAFAPAQPMATFAAVSPTVDAQGGDSPAATQTMVLLQSPQSLMEDAQITVIELPSSIPSLATKVTAKALNPPLPRDQLAAPVFAPPQSMTTFAAVSSTMDAQASDSSDVAQTMGLLQSTQSPMEDAQMTTIASPSIAESLAAMVTPKGLDSPLQHSQLATPAFAPPQPIATFTAVSPTVDAQGGDSPGATQTVVVLQSIQSSVAPQMTVIEPLNAPHAPPVAPSITPNVATLGEKALPSKQAIASATYPTELVTASPSLASLDDDTITTIPTAPSPESGTLLLDIPTVTTKLSHEPQVTPFIAPAATTASQALQTDRADVELSPTRAVIPTITQEPADTHDVRRKTITPTPSHPLEGVLPSIDPTPVGSISPALRPVTTNAPGERTVSPIIDAAIVEPQRYHQEPIPSHQLEHVPPSVDPTPVRSANPVLQPIATNVPDERTVSPVIDAAIVEPQRNQLEVMPEMVEDSGIRRLPNEPQTAREVNAPSNRQRLMENPSLTQLEARSINLPSLLPKGITSASYVSETQVAPRLPSPLQGVSAPVEHAVWIDHDAAGEFPPKSVAAEVAPVKPGFAGNEERTSFAPMIERGVKREIAQATLPQTETAPLRQWEWEEEAISLAGTTPLSHPIENRGQPTSLPGENVTEKASTNQAISSASSIPGVQSVAQSVTQPDGELQIRPLTARLEQQNSPFQRVETPVRRTTPEASMTEPSMTAMLPAGKKTNAGAPQQVDGSPYAGLTHFDSPQTEMTTYPLVASPMDRMRSKNASLAEQRVAHSVRPLRSVDLVAIVQNGNGVIASNVATPEQQSMALAPMPNVTAQVADAPTAATAIRPQAEIFAPVRKQQLPAKPQPLPTIRVTIGRVVVQTTAEVSTMPAPPRQPAQPALSLDAYLQPRQREVL